MAGVNTRTSCYIYNSQFVTFKFQTIKTEDNKINVFCTSFLPLYAMLHNNRRKTTDMQQNIFSRQHILFGNKLSILSTFESIHK